MRIFLPGNDNCLFWISGSWRITVETISRSVFTKVMWPSWKLKLRFPPPPLPPIPYSTRSAVIRAIYCAMDYAFTIADVPLLESLAICWQGLGIRIKQLGISASDKARVFIFKLPVLHFGFRDHLICVLICFVFRPQAEHEFCPTNKSQITNNIKFFLAKHSWAWKFLC